MSRTDDPRPATAPPAVQPAPDTTVPAPAEPVRPVPPSARRRLDGPRLAPVATLLAGGLSALLGSARGVDGAALSAVLGSVVTVLFFWIGAVPLLLVGGNLSLAGVGFVLLVTTYALRLIALIGVLAVASRSDAVDLRWLALTVIACALVWVMAQVALVGRSRATL